MTSHTLLIAEVEASRSLLSKLAWVLRLNRNNGPVGSAGKNMIKYDKIFLIKYGQISYRSFRYLRHIDISIRYFFNIVSLIYRILSQRYIDIRNFLRTL